MPIPLVGVVATCTYLHNIYDDGGHSWPSGYISPLFCDTLEIQSPLDGDGVRFDERRRFLVRCLSKAAAHDYADIVGACLDWIYHQQSLEARDMALLSAAG